MAQLIRPRTKDEDGVAEPLEAQQEAAFTAMGQAIINIGRTAAAHEKKINDIEIQVAQTLKLMSKILKALDAETPPEWDEA